MIDISKLGHFYFCIFSNSSNEKFRFCKPKLQWVYKVFCKPLSTMKF